MKKYYYLGFAVYVFSFFLPAIRMFDAPMKGYACALIIFMGFFEANSFVAYLSALFLNLPNILTLFVFVLHFKFPLQRLFALQALALLSACYWAVLLALKKPRWRQAKVLISNALNPGFRYAQSNLKAVNRSLQRAIRLWAQSQTTQPSRITIN